MLAAQNPEMRTSFFSRSWTACAAAALAAVLANPLLAPLAQAAEAPAKPATPTAGTSNQTSAQTAVPGGERRERQDPLDIVRTRLAQKLGAGKFASNGGSSVIRVVSSPTAALAPLAAVVAAPSAPRVAKVASKRTAAVKDLPAETQEQVAAPQWDYQGAVGPQAWAQLKPEFATCANGKRQSPIDIRDGIKVQLDPVQFDYHATKFRVLDTGRTVQVNVEPGNFIEVTGKRFELQQFQFHRPSEVRIDGRLFDMAAHLIHKDAEGRVAIVAVLLEGGNAQPVVQAIWNNLPLEKGDEVAARLPIDLNELLPADRSYYTHMGSLTTPPCSEGVLWLVMKTPVTLSAEQIAIFARLYPMNARPVQAASGRLIKESN